MRSEKQMLELILAFARERDDIRAVIMTGSRTDPHSVPDLFQDYDITYLVKDVAPYRSNPTVPAQFGETMIFQMPDDMAGSDASARSYAFLMQFGDGNRIDLTFRPLDDLNPVLSDSLSLVLLDKDNRFDLPPPSIRSYLPQKPAAKQFDDCCNEFWWLNPYVAKGLYRDQIPYAKSILDRHMRTQLLEMLTWYVGWQTNFSVSVGYLGKHLKTHLSPDLWQQLLCTYSDAQHDAIWNALFAMNELFRDVAQQIAKAYDFAYPSREDAAVSAYLRQIRLQIIRQ